MHLYAADELHLRAVDRVFVNEEEISNVCELDDEEGWVEVVTGINSEHTAFDTARINGTVTVTLKPGFCFRAGGIALAVIDERIS